MGSKWQNSTFWEHDHFAYQIKGKHECSNMVANILSTQPCSPPSPDPGVKRSKFNFFRTFSDCISNKIESLCGNVIANILPADPLLPPTNPWAGVKMSKLSFSKHGHVAYQIKWNHKCSHMVANISPTTPPPLGAWGSKG